MMMMLFLVVGCVALIFAISWFTRRKGVVYRTLRDEIDAEARLVAVPRGTGRGIVMCAGGRRYLAEAYASLRTVRNRGCTLPVEIFYVGREEMPSLDCISRFEENVGNVTFRDATSYVIGKVRPTKLRGYEIKPYALLLASFDEILMLDADCGVLEDPTILFSDPAFLKHGNMFWPDYWYHKNLIRPQLGSDFGTTSYPPGFETESGQVLVKKSACKEALVYAWLLNKHQDVMYSLYYGDKDLFRVGFNMAGTTFYQVPRIPGILGFTHEDIPILDTMVQYAPDGTPMFVHRTQKKVTKRGKRSWTEFIPNGGAHRYSESAAAHTGIPDIGLFTCTKRFVRQRRIPPRDMIDTGNAIDDDEEILLKT